MPWGKWDDKRRNAASIRMKEFFSNPENRRIVSERNKKRYKDPKARLAVSKKMRKFYEDPEKRLAVSRRMSLQGNPRWKNGESITHKLAFEVYGMKKECNRCGSKEKIVVHHINKDRTDNSKENFEILCNPCHNSHHKKGIIPANVWWKYYKKMPPHIGRKISLAIRGKNNPFYGKNWDDYGGHPKGMLGKKHSEKIKKQISRTLKGLYKTGKKKYVKPNLV